MCIQTMHNSLCVDTMIDIETENIVIQSDILVLQNRWCMMKLKLSYQFCKFRKLSIGCMDVLSFFFGSLLLWWFHISYFSIAIKNRILFFKYVAFCLFLARLSIEKLGRRWQLKRLEMHLITELMQSVPYEKSSFYVTWIMKM